MRSMLRDEKAFRAEAGDCGIYVVVQGFLQRREDAVGSLPS